MDRRFKITMAIFAVIALVLLWGEHKVHLLGALPWLIILACLLTLAKFPVLVWMNSRVSLQEE